MMSGYIATWWYYMIAPPPIEIVRERDQILKIDDVPCETYIFFKYLRKQIILRKQNKTPGSRPIPHSSQTIARG
jgi:hypothetical protein